MKKSVDFLLLKYGEPLSAKNRGGVTTYHLEPGGEKRRVLVVVDHGFTESQKRGSARKSFVNKGTGEDAPRENT